MDEINPIMNRIADRLSQVGGIQAYTVREVAKLSGVTIKTLYHYQKTGLMMPESVAENGYRYYGEKELEQLQQILFYRALDFPLETIKRAMQNGPSRLRCLCEQKSLLLARQQRLSRIVQTLNEAIDCAGKGVQMSMEKLFHGLNQREWEYAFRPQNEHLQEQYDYVIDTNALDVNIMNNKANEAAEFMTIMADALRNGVKVNDEHIAYLAKDMDMDAEGFAAQSRF